VRLDARGAVLLVDTFGAAIRKKQNKKPNIIEIAPTARARCALVNLRGLRELPFGAASPTVTDDCC
jgi:hypothetical protein